MLLFTFLLVFMFATFTGLDLLCNGATVCEGDSDRETVGIEDFDGNALETDDSGGKTIDEANSDRVVVGEEVSPASTISLSSLSVYMMLSSKDISLIA